VYGGIDGSKTRIGANRIEEDAQIGGKGPDRSPPKMEEVLRRRGIVLYAVQSMRKNACDENARGSARKGSYQLPGPSPGGGDASPVSRQSLRVLAGNELQVVANAETAKRVRGFSLEADVLGSEPSKRRRPGHNTALVASELHAEFGLYGLPGDACRLHGQSQGLSLVFMVDVKAEVVHE
jgi:hypothetical protein